ncbi:MAG: hypothetical protein J5789_00505, partial [Oscillospiraceae bacterium]|nr:hypothetical protein [Oscillospiraceae bacterium]
PFLAGTRKGAAGGTGVFQGRDRTITTQPDKLPCRKNVSTGNRANPSTGFAGPPPLDRGGLAAPANPDPAASGLAALRALLPDKIFIDIMQ